jgi:hypothetical protein
MLGLSALSSDGFFFPFAYPRFLRTALLPADASIARVVRAGRGADGRAGVVAAFARRCGAASA